MSVVSGVFSLLGGAGIGTGGAVAAAGAQERAPVQVGRGWVGGAAVAGLWRVSEPFRRVRGHVAEGLISGALTHNPQLTRMCRFKNTRFDVIGGALYYLSVVSLLPRCDAGRSMLVRVILGVGSAPSPAKTSGAPARAGAAPALLASPFPNDLTNPTPAQPFAPNPTTPHGRPPAAPLHLSPPFPYPPGRPHPGRRPARVCCSLPPVLGRPAAFHVSVAGNGRCFLLHMPRLRARRRRRRRARRARRARAGARARRRRRWRQAARRARRRAARRGGGADR